MPCFILMGVSGSGKTEIGQCAARKLGLPFIEGDDYHPPANIQKMAGGTPLEDADRVAWIDALMAAIDARPEPHLVVACSALTQFVREKIKSQSRRPVIFLHLTADAALIAQRLEARGPHFMKPGMLPSQLATLQPPLDAIVIDATQGIDAVCSAVCEQISARLSAT
jgi:gluconokinase